jgi:hypothetical protein
MPLEVDTRVLASATQPVKHLAESSAVKVNKIQTPASMVHTMGAVTTSVVGFSSLAPNQLGFQATVGVGKRCRAGPVRWLRWQGFEGG